MIMKNCLLCFGAATEIHHINPKSSHPEGRVDLENLIWVCRNCHMKIHSTNTEQLRQTLYNRQHLYAKIMPGRFAVTEDDLKFLEED